MTERRLILRDWQARAAAGRLRLVVVPIDPQPCRWTDEHGGESGFTWKPRFGDGPTWTRHEFTKLCPLGAAGDVLWAQETWLEMPDPDPELGGIIIKYRATDHVDAALHGGWRSSTSMPRWASRFTFEIERVDARRVQTVTVKEATLTGYETNWDEREFSSGWEGWRSWKDRELRAASIWAIDEWDARYPKFPFAGNPWAWFVGLKGQE